MKKTNKKGFTIFELVIVIAVIAVLAAVLIPTFSGIIEKANLSNDTSLVASINTAIAVEQVVSGDPNDAIEIAKIIKEYGMKLETKSKGNYLWYDIEKGKVILAGLNEDGIVLNDAGANARSTKGQFKEATSPESFVEGYLFITEESKDGLAEAISALHNPKGDNEEELKECLQEALADIQDHGNNKLYTVLNDFMSTTAVMTENGMAFCGATNNSVNRIIVSAGMKKVTPESLNRLSSYNNIIVVDFHSDVAEITPEAVDIIANENKIFYVYNNEKVEAIDKANGGDIAKLISKPDRHKFIKTFVLDYYEEIVDADGNKTFELLQEKAKEREFVPESYTLPYAFPYLFHSNGNQVYDFIAYSLYTDGANPIGVNLANGYTLTEAEQYLLTANDGVLKVNAFFKKANTDFKVNGVAYSSAGVTQMLADNTLLPNGTTTIAVVSTTATLDANLIVGEKPDNLTIPSGVELLLPIATDATQKAGLTPENTSTKPYANDGSFIYNKATMDGKTILTVDDSVKLIVEGTIYVDAKLYYHSTRYQCYVANDCGELVVNGTVQIGTRKEDGSVNKTGNLYAYGIVSGLGEIIAECGTVDEIFTVLDWGGGTSASNCIENNATPFHNWQIDNIRVPLTIKKDVTYGAYGSVYVRGDRSINFTLVGSSASNDTKTNPLFVLNKGAIQKTYDDGFNLALLDGAEVADAHKTVEIESITVDFKKVALPLPNFDIVVKNGAKLELNNNHYKVLPGSDVVVDEGGELIISTTVAFYDTYDLNLIQKYKNNDVLYTIAYIYKYKASNVAYTDKGLSLSYSALGSSGTAKCGVETYPYKASDANIGTALTVNGKLIFGEKAVFTGNIISNLNGATLEVKSGAKFNYTQDITDVSGNKKTVHGFTEGVAFSLELLGQSTGSIISCWQPSYAVGVDTTGMFVKAGTELPQQIPTTAATYTFNGSIWQ